MTKSLADGHEKLTILTTKPTGGWLNPTVEELNAGLHIDLSVLASDYNFGPTDSETFSERAIGESQNAEAFGVGNAQAAFTIFREFGANGQADALADTAFAALKLKGTTVGAYARRNGKLASADWAGSDEIRFGGEILTDTPQDPGQGGYVKVRVPAKVQRFIAHKVLPSGA